MLLFLGVFLFKESVSRPLLAVFCISTYIGVFGLVYFSNTMTDGALFGDALALMAALMYATYLLIISKLGKESSINIIFYTTLFTGLFGLIPALIESRDFLPSSKDRNIQFICHGDYYAKLEVNFLLLTACQNLQHLLAP